MSYFSKFPVMQYPVKDGNAFRFALTRNILRRVALNADIKSGDGFFLKYDVKDGERPEHIAERVYGDPSFHWIILLTNDIVDPYHGWYKSSAAMEEYIQNKYGGYSVYIGTTSGGFFYNTNIISGVTLTQQGNSPATVIDYQPELCKLTVRGSAFSEGDAVLGFSGGSSATVTIYRVDPSFTALHHFEVSRPSGDCGANQTAYVDPLSQQNTSYSVVGGVVGREENEYPSDAEGMDYVPSGIVDFWETYIGGYMGVSGDQINLYSVSNYTYENDLNESKRSIKVLHPRYKSVALKELESLLRV